MAIVTNKEVGKVEYDSIIADLNPATNVFSVTLRKATGTPVTLKRGTVLALSKGTRGDGKMVIFGTEAGGEETLEANAVLCDDVTVGTEADVQTVAYRTGHFNRQKMIVKESANIADAEDALRKNGIILSDVI